MVEASIDGLVEVGVFIEKIYEFMQLCFGVGRRLRLMPIRYHEAKIKGWTSAFVASGWFWRFCTVDIVRSWASYMIAE